MKTRTNRITSLLLAAVFLLTLFGAIPAMAAASGEDPAEAAISVPDSEEATAINPDTEEATAVSPDSEEEEAVNQNSAEATAISPDNVEPAEAAGEVPELPATGSDEPLITPLATVDVSGSHVIDHLDGTMTFVLKGVAPINITTNDIITLICTDMAYDFTMRAISATAPLTTTMGGMNQIELFPSALFTIPAAGIEVNISGVAYNTSGGTGDTLDLLIMGDNDANATIPVYHGGMPGGNGDITLGIAISSNTFSPDWEGALAAPATVTVTALIAPPASNAGTTDTTVNGRVVIYSGNGPITLINGQSYLYADMVSGVGTATIDNLTDMGALNATYNVDLTAAMPLYDAVADSPAALTITPNPLSITGKVVDDSNSGIAGASVCLLTADGYMASRTETNASGQYTLYGSPRSSSYRVIAYTDELYGEATKNLLPQPAVQDITLYSQIKVTVNFYRNKATLDGTPNSGVVSPANLYAAGAYDIEAYSDSGGKIPVRIEKREGSLIYVRQQDVINGGGQLFVKATPYTVQQPPYTDNSSQLYEVTTFPAEIIEALESPVGSITVRNNATKAITVYFSSDESFASFAYQTSKYETIQPGGMYSYVPDEGYASVDTPIFVAIYQKWEVALVRMGRSAEFSFTDTDIGYGVGSLMTSESAGGNVNVSFTPGQISRDVAVAIYSGVYGQSANQYFMWETIFGLTTRVELSSGLELAPDWVSQINATSCKTSRILTAEDMVVTQTGNGFTVRIPFSYGHFFPNNYYGVSVTDLWRAMPWTIHFPVRARDGGASYQAHSIKLSRLYRSNINTYGLYLINVDESYPYEYSNHIQTYSFTTGRPFSIEGPYSASGGRAFIQGAAAPNSTVVIRVEGYPNSLTVNSNSAGRYSGYITLPETDQVQDFTITATAGGQSASCKVRQKGSVVYATELWVETSQSGAGGFNKSYLVMNNSLANGVLTDSCAGQVQNITLGTTIKFRVRVNDNSKAQKVFVSTGAAGMSNIPCRLVGAYWESEELTGMSWGGSYRINDFTVTIVKRLGHEYMSPADIEADMRESAEALAAWTPPNRMFTDTEAYMNELQQAMLEALPPELRSAAYTDLGGGVTQMSILMGNGSTVNVGLSSEAITGAELTALSAKAQVNGIPVGGGFMYQEINYICTLSGGGTKSYTQEEFDDALYEQRLAHPYETSEQLLNRLNITNVRMETVQYSHIPQITTLQTHSLTSESSEMEIRMMSEPLFGSSEGVRNAVEITTAGLGAIMESPLKNLAPVGSQVAGAAAGGVNTAVSALGLPDKVMQSNNAGNLVNSYEAMYENFKSLQYTECFSKLSPEYKTWYANQLAYLENNMSDAAKLKWISYGNTASSSLTVLGSAGLTVYTAGGFAEAEAGGYVLLGNIANFLGSSLSSFFDYDGRFQFLFGAYKDSYNTIQRLNDTFKEDMALACGEKELTKSQGAYQFIYDPSGIAYDGTLEYPLEGVRAELWVADDENGTNARFWAEAEDYDQINPQITDETGYYTWFTPEGFWQVRVSKQGYQDRQSEWLEVLPPRFGVHLNMGGEPLTITYDGNGGELPIPEFIANPNDPDYILNQSGFPQTVFQVPQGRNHTAIANEYKLQGYYFTGWNTQADGSGASYAAGATISNVQSDMTLYARWAPVTVGAVTTPPAGDAAEPEDAEEPEEESGEEPETQAWTNPFDDVSETDWFYPDVAYVNQNGLMQGVGGNLFSPKTPLTRGMVVTVLYRIEGEPDVSSLPKPFDDVNDVQYYASAVRWAAANGIVFGFPGGVYKPNDNVSRQDLALILNRYADFKGMELPAKKEYAAFADDANIANYAKDAVVAFFEAGIILGKEYNMYDPTGIATRAEFAAMIHRLLDS